MSVLGFHNHYNTPMYKFEIVNFFSFCLWFFLFKVSTVCLLLFSSFIFVAYSSFFLFNLDKVVRLPRTVIFYI